MAYNPEDLVDVDLDLDDETMELLIEQFDEMFPHKHSAVPLHMLEALQEEEYIQMKIKVMLVSSIKKGLSNE